MRISSPPFRSVIELLGLAVDVLRDDTAGAVEDGLGRAVVALELDHPGVGVVALEVEDVADVGTAPGVDRLVRVADHAEVAVLLRDLLDELVLHAIRVLVLVDQDVLPAAPVVGEHLRKAIEELRGLQEQVAEVEGVGVDEQPLVGVVDLGGALAVDVGGAGRRLRRAPCRRSSSRRSATGCAADRSSWDRDRGA